MGQAAFYGIALIANSWSLAIVALIGHIITTILLKYVEEPHMIKVYGNSLVRRESGVEKGVKKEVNKIMNKDARIKNIFESVQHDIHEIGLKKVLSHKSLKVMVNKWANSLNNSEIVSNSDELSDDENEGTVLLNSSRNLQNNLKKRHSTTNKIIEKTKEVVEDTAEKVVQHITTPRAIDNHNSNQNLSSNENALVLPPSELYHLEIQSVNTNSNNSNNNNTYGNELESLSFELGSPILIQWSAPKKYITSTDWIGVYRVTQNKKRSVTTTNCKGRWVYALTGQGKTQSSLDSDPEPLEPEKLEELIKTSKVVTSVKNNKNNEEIVSGELVFEKSLIPWEIGSYELRYHYKNGYNVLTVSQPFEILGKKKFLCI